MLVLLCYFLAVTSWFCGAINLSYTTGTPPRTHAPNWLCLGLFFTGLALWFAPLV